MGVELFHALFAKLGSEVTRHSRIDTASYLFIHTHIILRRPAILTEGLI